MSPLRLPLAVVACLLLAGPAHSGDARPLDARVRGLVDPLLESNASRCGQAYAPVFDAVAEPGFDRLPAATRRKVLTAVVACSRREATAPAVAVIRRLEPLADTAQARADANQVLMIDAGDRKDFPEAARRLIRVIDADPARVAGWWPPFLGQIAFGKGVRDDRALGLALFGRLTTLAWVDKESQEAARNNWAAQYAELLADEGDLAGARIALANMDSTALWMAVAQDRRYATLWPAFGAEGRFDWRKRTDLELGQVMARHAANPAELVHVYDALQLLRQLQRYDEAIAMGQTYRERIKAGEEFKDLDRFGNWVLNELAYALLDLGNTAEAEDVFLESIQIGEHGAPSVSQRINWAEKLDVLGRPREAMDILATLGQDRVSPYGKMWNDAEMVCALSQTGDDGLPVLLASMQSRWEDNPSALTQALICADRQDEAAALYVRRLESPRHRGGALEAFRVVLSPPFLTPRQTELERRRSAVLARPEVRQAMLAVGRSIELSLAGAYWGSM